jgi:DNA-binding NtrC family response regulator
MPTDYDTELQRAKRMHGIVGRSSKMDEALVRALRAAKTDLSVLVTGENGVGKENVARIIMENSRRKSGKYITVNCGAIPPGTVDSELFGHKKGAFTGALDNRKGYFEEANGGTIFLDEIGELPLETQARLLRVLENKEFIPVGASEPSRTDVRVIAATNADLVAKIAQGKFRQDLFYRLNMIAIVIPPLRERTEDLPILVAKFAEDLTTDNHYSSVEFLPEAIDALKTYRWPGNIRQLKHFVERIVVLETERTIGADTVRRYLQDEPNYPDKYDVALSNSTSEENFKQYHQVVLGYIQRLEQEINTLKEGMQELYRHIESQQGSRSHLALSYNVNPTEEATAEEVTDNDSHETRQLEETELETIIATLHKFGGNRKATADALGISERTLYRKIKKHGL